MDLDELIQDLNIAKDECDVIIGAEQRNQIEALKIAVSSLKSMIKSKDERISELENELSTSNNVISRIIKHEKENSPDVNRLRTIETMPTLNKKIQELYNYMGSKTVNNGSDDAVVERLRSQLHGHVELLTRLIEMPEYEHLFLVSNHSGNTFLRESTHDILVEQARRTNELLSEVSNSNPEKSKTGDIYDVLSMNIDHKKRISMLKQLITSDDINQNEAKTLLIQEAGITSFLSSYAIHLRESVAKAEKIKNLPKSDSDFDLRAQNVFVDLNKALRKNMKYSKDSFIECSKQAAADLLLLRTYLDEGFNDIPQYIVSLKEYIPKLEKRIMKLKRRCSEKQLSPSRNEWEPWARRLYTGLMGFGIEVESYSDMRIAIEEAALTSVGNGILQERLNSLKKRPGNH